MIIETTENNNIEENSLVSNEKTNIDNKGRSYATGKRKNSIARVWLKKGDGKISINGKSTSLGCVSKMQE